MIRLLALVGRQTYGQTHAQTDRQTDSWTDRQTEAQVDRQTGLGVDSRMRKRVMGNQAGRQSDTDGRIAVKQCGGASLDVITMQVMPYRAVFRYFSCPPRSMNLSTRLAEALISAGVSTLTPA